MSIADDDEREDDDFEPTPPTAARVAARALVLAAVSCRGFVERDFANEGTADFWAEVREWFDGLGIDDELEAGERTLLDTPLGELRPQQAVDAGWLCEGMLVLAWALGRCEMPPFPDQCDPAEVATALGFHAAREETVLAAPVLRPREQLDEFDSTVLAAHWRLRQQRVRPGAMDFADFVAKCQWAVLSTRGLELVEGDLAIRGVPVHRVAPDVLASTTSLVQERHRASNWLAGTDALWSDVTTDT